jgi:hypothetical protein
LRAYEAQSAKAWRDGGFPLSWLPDTIVAMTVHVVAELGYDAVIAA